MAATIQNMLLSPSLHANHEKHNKTMLRKKKTLGHSEFHLWKKQNPQAEIRGT